MIEKSIKKLLEPGFERKIKWVSPKELITPSNLSVHSKIPYVRARLFDVEDRFSLKIYLETQFAINGLNESEPLRNSSEEFIENFNSLIDSMTRKSWQSSDSIIFKNQDGFAINGSHRLAIAYVLDLLVPVVETDIKRNNNLGLLDIRNNVSADTIRSILFLETYLHLNICPIIVFPTPDFDSNLFELELSQISTVYWHEKMDLNIKQLAGLNNEMYQHEKWFRNTEDPLRLGMERAGYIWEMQGRPKNTTVSVYYLKDFQYHGLQDLKNRTRQRYEVGNYVIHSPSNNCESYYLAKILLDRESRRFLLSGNSGDTKSYVRGLKNLVYLEDSTQVLHNEVLVTGSSILEAWGLRRAEDLDCIFLEKNEELNQIAADDHSNEFLDVLVKTKNYGVEQSISHFVHIGFYWMSLEAWAKLLLLRGGDKSNLDIKLITKMNGSKVSISLELILLKWKIVIVHTFSKIWLKVKPFTPKLIKRYISLRRKRSSS